MLKKLFSKSDKDCCSVEIEEVEATEDENENCCGEAETNSEKQKKEA